MATSSYKQPKTVPSVAAGEGGGKKTLTQRTVTVGAVRNTDYPGVKTSGIKIRGTGAAKKGVMARGPMA